VNRIRRGALLGAGAAAALAGVGVAVWRERGDDGRGRGDQVEDGSASDPRYVGKDDALTPAFWALRFERPEGGQLELADLRDRLLLLNFWATWCAPCVRELPRLDRFQRENGGAGWRVVGVAVDARASVREFLDRTPVGFAVGLAGLEGSRLSRALGNADGALPFSVVVDRSGRVRDRVRGETFDDRLRHWLQVSPGWRR
jgi:thiol-disulfide isomerase/thioredoxin